jgi:protocatechuate 3,4-dioxygenase beta subunit
MDHDQTLSRRRFAGAALTAAGLIATGGIARAAVPAQTADDPMGPFYPVLRPGGDDFDMTMIRGNSARALGRVIEVTGRVLDRKGNPVGGAELELWQCNAAGRYAHPGDIATAPLDPNFQGFAKLMTGPSGEWRVITIKPSGYDSPIGHRTPHIHFDRQSDRAPHAAHPFRHQGTASAVDHADVFQRGSRHQQRRPAL